jgi:hypothetical protein
MSAAFWDAFWTGLACPTLLYVRGRGEPYKQVGRVDAAWKKAGGYIYGSVDAMADDIDNSSGDRRVK